MQTVFFGHSRITSEIYNRIKIQENTLFIYVIKLNNIPLNTSWGKDDITRENKSILNQMKIKPHNMSKFLGYNYKVVLRGKFIAINTPIRKKKSRKL